MRAPPQRLERPISRNTTQGYSLGSVSLPPNILFGLLGIPQLQTEPPGVVVVVVSETVDEGDGLVCHGLGVGGIVLGLKVVAGGPQQEIFSGDKYKVSKTLFVTLTIPILSMIAFIMIVWLVLWS